MQQQCKVLNVVHVFWQNWDLRQQIHIVLVHFLRFCRQRGKDNCCQWPWLNMMVSAFHEQFTGCACVPFPSACFINRQECTALMQALPVDSSPARQ